MAQDHLQTGAIANPVTVSRTDTQYLGTLGLYAVEYVEWTFDESVSPPVRREMGRFGAIVSASGYHSTQFVGSYLDALAELDMLDGQLSLANRQAFESQSRACTQSRPDWLAARHLREMSHTENVLFNTSVEAGPQSDNSFGL